MMFQQPWIRLVMAAACLIALSANADKPAGRKVGLLNHNHTLDLVLALPLKNQEQLDQLLVELYDPTHANYRKYLTPDEFRDRYCPENDTIANLTRKLHHKSLRVTSVSANNVLVHVRGSVAKINQAFNVELSTYLDDADGSFYHAPGEGESPELLDGVLTVFGLDNGTSHRHHSTRSLKGARELSGSPEGYTPTLIRRAYGLSSTDGSGQSVALVQFDTYRPSDITAYQQYFKLPSVNVQSVRLPPQCSKCCRGKIVKNKCRGKIVSCCVNSPTSPGKGAGEVTLDIQMVLSIAENIDNLFVYTAPNNGAGGFALYNKIATDNKAKVVSTSWGMAETSLTVDYVQAYNTIFKQMAAQGQSMFAASGDSGAFDNGQTLSVDDPSSQPFVTGVGGTTLFVNNNGDYVKETSWYSSEQRWGGGGGISQFWSIPDYQSQSGVVTSANKGSSSSRNVPDVSLLADPDEGFPIYLAGKWVVVGGTSAATPIWASFTTLVNAKRVQAGKLPLGFVNPALYALGVGSHASQVFHDVKDGSTNGHYPAVTGYDLSTGWGSFVGDALLSALAALP